MNDYHNDKYLRYKYKYLLMKAGVKIVTKKCTYCDVCGNVKSIDVNNAAIVLLTKKEDENFYKILFVHNKINGHWSIPGGMIDEKDNDCDEALMREFYKETSAQTKKFVEYNLDLGKVKNLILHPWFDIDKKSTTMIYIGEIEYTYAITIVNNFEVNNETDNIGLFNLNDIVNIVKFGYGQKKNVNIKYIAKEHKEVSLKSFKMEDYVENSLHEIYDLGLLGKYLSKRQRHIKFKKQKQLKSVILFDPEKPVQE